MREPDGEVGDCPSFDSDIVVTNSGLELAAALTVGVCFPLGVRDQLNPSGSEMEIMIVDEGHGRSYLTFSAPGSRDLEIVVILDGLQSKIVGINIESLDGSQSLLAPNLTSYRLNSRKLAGSEGAISLQSADQFVSTDLCVYRYGSSAIVDLRSIQQEPYSGIRLIHRSTDPDTSIRGPYATRDDFHAVLDEDNDIVGLMCPWSAIPERATTHAPDNGQHR